MITLSKALLGKIGEELAMKILEEKGFYVERFSCPFYMCSFIHADDSLPINAESCPYSKKRKEQGHILVNERCPRGDNWILFTRRIQLHSRLCNLDLYAEKEGKQYVIETKTTQKSQIRKLLTSNIIQDEEKMVLEIAKEFGFTPIVIYLKINVDIGIDDLLIREI